MAQFPLLGSISILLYHIINLILLNLTNIYQPQHSHYRQGQIVAQEYLPSTSGSNGNVPAHKPHKNVTSPVSNDSDDSDVSDL